MHKRLCLRPDCFNDFWVAVPADVHSYSCDAVDVLSAFGVPDPGTAAAGYGDGLAGVRGLDVSCFCFYGGHEWGYCCEQWLIWFSGFVVLRVAAHIWKGSIHRAANRSEKVNEMFIKDLKVSKVELDELWTFVKKSVPGVSSPEEERWMWVCFAKESRLLLCIVVGPRIRRFRRQINRGNRFVSR
uniref:Uncharacterized protein n=1 Tax=Candidatus Methanogaster sp. ANME-2c ERB4 TaxID=2759911 RepID=A0A7G9YAX3_9EURY|nr:hypothetical protein GMDKAGHH_00010 [Methanosarcinales archaeon ANME-2c ERB4]QNO46041.1 hypothetical protein OOGCPJEC_00026 [Methanosarcinales archaeon ANME-2c ERB4]